MTRTECLERAQAVVCGEREKQYGTPEDNFKIIADLWAVYLGTEITPKDVAMMMALLKIARIKNDNFKADSFIDLAGYAACGCEISAGDGNEKLQD